MATYISYSKLETADTKPSLTRCPFKGCHARVIPVGSLPKVVVENSPEMTMVEKPGETEPVEKQMDFFQVNDVWDFDNIGVSRPSADIKQPVVLVDGAKLDIAIERLLICLECDRGPLGFAGLLALDEQDHKNLKYFVSCSSVLYE